MSSGTFNCQTLNTIDDILKCLIHANSFFIGILNTIDDILKCLIHANSFFIGILRSEKKNQK